MAESNGKNIKISYIANKNNLMLSYAQSSKDCKVDLTCIHCTQNNDRVLQANLS